MQKRDYRARDYGSGDRRDTGARVDAIVTEADARGHRRGTCRGRGRRCRDASRAKRRSENIRSSPSPSIGFCGGRTRAAAPAAIAHLHADWAPHARRSAKQQWLWRRPVPPRSWPDGGRPDARLPRHSGRVLESWRRHRRPRSPQAEHCRGGRHSWRRPILPRCASARSIAGLLRRVGRGLRINRTAPADGRHFVHVETL